MPVMTIDRMPVMTIDRMSGMSIDRKIGLVLGPLQSTGRVAAAVVAVALGIFIVCFTFLGFDKSVEDFAAKVYSFAGKQIELAGKELIPGLSYYFYRKDEANLKAEAEAKRLSLEALDLAQPHANTGLDVVSSGSSRLAFLDLATAAVSSMDPVAKLVATAESLVSDLDAIAARSAARDAANRT